MSVARPLADRFWEKVDVIDDPDSCWLWTASTDRKGYGKIGAGGRNRGTLVATRVAYELQIGPIPLGMSVLHRCDMPLCVRGSHLFAGTQADNIRDMVEKGRERPVPRACPRGHPYPENARWYGKKRKNLTCLQCIRDRRVKVTQ